MNMLKTAGYLLLLALSPQASAGEEPATTGIDCDTLPAWSDEIEGYQINLHHIYCGEPGRKGRAKGFHATPLGDAPSNYISSEPADGPNGAGIYAIRKVDLMFNGAIYVKSFSSMFPRHCSFEQINNSIVYSLRHSRGGCVSPAPTWASCGPNAPAEGGGAYCTGSDGSGYTIASALLPDNETRINTGFPIYQP